MADVIHVNGGGGGAGDIDVERASTEQFSDETTNQKLMQKLSNLEQEKQQLMNDKESTAEKIKQLEDEISRSESDKRALSSIAARAAELEIEVSRLQHDLITSISDGQESNTELSELKRLFEELKKSESEKSEKIDVIDKERNLLLERFNESADKLNDYETKIVEKDEQILSLNKLIEELEKSKKEIEIGKNDLESLLKKSERKVIEMEQELNKKEDINDIVKEEDCDENMSNLKKLDWPVVAVAAGAVTILAVVYFRHAKF